MGLLDLFAKWRIPAPELAAAPAVDPIVIAPITVPDHDLTPVLVHKNHQWVQQGEVTEKGLVTFARDVVVAGKIAQSSITVREADLLKTGHVYTLNGQS